MLHVCVYAMYVHLCIVCVMFVVCTVCGVCNVCCVQYVRACMVCAYDIIVWLVQPVVVVPEGLEPEQLLNLYKGKCIIHNGTQVANAARLYRVSGATLLTMKAVEITPPTVASLNSSHTYILCSQEGEWFVWAGQFSSEIHRTGALIIVKTLAANSNK